MSRHFFRLSHSISHVLQVIEEIKRAETLQEDLKAKHRARQRELKQSLRARREKDVKEEMRSAKDKSREKLERSLRMKRDEAGSGQETPEVGAEEAIEATEARAVEAEAVETRPSRRGSREPLLDEGSE